MEGDRWTEEKREDMEKKGEGEREGERACSVVTKTYPSMYSALIS